MTQRSVESVIGRLVSDEELRRHFRENPRAVLATLCRQGLPLNAVEIEALAGLDARVLERLARVLDARLQRASLAPERDAAAE